jgi:hypothetical protein
MCARDVRIHIPFGSLARVGTRMSLVPGLPVPRTVSTAAHMWEMTMCRTWELGVISLASPEPSFWMLHHR